MKAVAWHGKRDVRVDTVPDPTIQVPTDAIVRITSSGICGSDLHLYEVLGMFMTAGDILGHEPMGIVEEVGADVSHIAKGDRVVIPFNISCGHCWMCDRELYSQCETTQVHEHEKGAALLGYTKLYGQVPGGQAEFLRVPQAHFGPIKVPAGLPDERYVYLSDVLPTAWQAVEYAQIPDGGTVAVFGLGPIGQMSARIARHRGAAQVFAIDLVPERMAMAERHGIQVLDWNEHEDLSRTLRELTDGRGPDSVIDAVGMEAHGSSAGKFAQTAAGLLPDTVSQKLVDKGGVDRLSVVYAAHDLAVGRLWRLCEPGELYAAVRQADHDQAGAGERQALDRRPHAARLRRGRPAQRHGPRHAQGADRRGTARLRDLSEEAGRRDQGPDPALARCPLNSASTPRAGVRW